MAKSAVARINELKAFLAEHGSKPAIIGESAAARNLRAIVPTLSNLASAIAIVGEPGTGKELIAHCIHSANDSGDKAFISIDLVTLPPEMLPFVISGKGFADGSNESGCFEAAKGGTIFLNQPHRLEEKLQEKLHKALSEAAKLEGVRLISAFNQDPRTLVRRRELVEGLYEKLCMIQVEIPSLRKRREDIPKLAEHFLKRSCICHHRPAMKLSRGALKSLKESDWPRNVSQLEDLIDRAVCFSDNDTIEPEFVSNNMRADFSPVWRDAPEDQQSGGLRVIEEVQKKSIMEALDKTNGDVREAAEILGLGPATVYRKIKRFGLVRTRNTRKRGRKPRNPQKNNML